MDKGLILSLTIQAKQRSPGSSEANPHWFGKKHSSLFFYWKPSPPSLSCRVSTQTQAYVSERNIFIFFFFIFLKIISVTNDKDHSPILGVPVLKIFSMPQSNLCSLGGHHQTFADLLHIVGILENADDDGISTNAMCKWVYFGLGCDKRIMI